MTGGAQRTLFAPRLAVPAAIVVAIVGFAVLSVVARSPGAHGGAGAGVALALRHTKLGDILVDANGRTLYLFLEDAPGKSTCYGGCARVWPAALVTGKPKAGPGIDAAKLTTAARRHSVRRQLVYDHHPLYTTVADAKPGATTGQGFFGTWFVVSAGGKQIGKAAKGAGGY
ncbi:MAG TPA: hypothetical protein VGF63_02890 [Solirubrobacteraceae bacterium]